MELTDKQIIAHLAEENYRLECENAALKAQLKHSIPVQMSSVDFINILGELKNENKFN